MPDAFAGIAQKLSGLNLPVPELTGPDLSAPGQLYQWILAPSTLFSSSRACCRNSLRSISL